MHSEFTWRWCEAAPSNSLKSEVKAMLNDSDSGSETC